jgi:hypothetical protein
VAQQKTKSNPAQTIYCFGCFKIRAMSFIVVVFLYGVDNAEESVGHVPQQR